MLGLPQGAPEISHPASFESIRRSFPSATPEPNRPSQAVTHRLGGPRHDLPESQQHTQVCRSHPLSFHGRFQTFHEIRKKVRWLGGFSRVALNWGSSFSHLTSTSSVHMFHRGRSAALAVPLTVTAWVRGPTRKIPKGQTGALQSTSLSLCLPSIFCKDSTSDDRHGPSISTLQLLALPRAKCDLQIHRNVRTSMWVKARTVEEGGGETQDPYRRSTPSFFMSFLSQAS